VKSTKLYSEIKKIYENMGIAEDLVDLMADFDILREIAAGRSNKAISERLDIDEDDVKEVAKKYFDFEGFDKDFGFDPYTIYRRCNGNSGAFSYEVTLTTAEANPDDITLAYRVCRKFAELERRINEEWR